MNDGCLAKGLINGYGLAQHTSNWMCYNTHEEVRGLVRAWFQKRWDAGFTLPESLCYYNRGLKINDCPYYRKYMSL